LRGLKALGCEVVGALRYVCSDMWQPYLSVIDKQDRHALHTGCGKERVLERGDGLTKLDLEERCNEEWRKRLQMVKRNCSVIGPTPHSTRYF
jgi:hypothetical protein